MTSELDRFGELLMEYVRDRSIRQADALLSGKLKRESSRAMIERLHNLSPESRAVIHDLVPMIVDDTLFFTLFHLDERRTQFSTDMVDGESFKPVGYVHGELAGWLFNEDGWVARYSRERSTSAE